MLYRHASLSGFVLAGGESRRMGQPKALLMLGGETMLERQVRLLRMVCRRVAVSGSLPNLPDLGVPVLPDEVPRRGPLGGIFTSLLHARTEFSLVVGCDLPFLQARLLDDLARRAFECQVDITVPEDKFGAIQPLCAVYRRRALAAVRASLGQGANKTSGFFDRVCCHVIPWRAIARAGFPSAIFANMNTLADYEMAKRIVDSELCRVNGELAITLCRQSWHNSPML